MEAKTVISDRIFREVPANGYENGNADRLFDLIIPGFPQITPARSRWSG